MFSTQHSIAKTSSRGLILFMISVLRHLDKEDEIVTSDDFPGMKMNSLEKTSCRKQKVAKSLSVKRNDNSLLLQGRT